MLLSKRQQEVMQYMAWGLKSREIASRLHISYNTVKTHRQNAYYKLGATGAAQAVAIALKEGIVEGEPPWEQS